jgi:hypothetical protein
MAETMLTLKQRRPFSLTLTCEKQDKSRLDLTGSSLRMAISKTKRKGGESVFAGLADLVSAADGTARFDVQATFLDIDAGLYDMAITLTSAEGFESTIIEGPVQVTRNIDPTPFSTFTDVVPPLSLTARFRDTNRVTVKVNHHPDSVLLDAATRAEAAGGIATTAADRAEVQADAAWLSAAAAASAAGSVQASLDQATAQATAAQAAATSADASADAAAASQAATAALVAQAGGSEADAEAAAAAAAAALAAATAAAAAAAASAAAAAAIITVKHGDDEYRARPNSAIVHWVGMSRPVNGIPTDFWTKVTLP